MNAWLPAKSRVDKFFDGFDAAEIRAARVEKVDDSRAFVGVTALASKLREL